MRRVLAALFAPGRPSWSADGNTIALAARMRYSTRFREGHNQILTVNLTTGEQKYYPAGEQFDTITDARQRRPGLFSRTASGWRSSSKARCMSIPVDNTGKPTGAPVKINNHATDSISWSGDSDWILYANNGELKMVSRDGSRTRYGAARSDIPQRRRPMAARSFTPASSGTQRAHRSARTSTSRSSATASRASGPTRAPCAAIT